MPAVFQVPRYHGPDPELRALFDGIAVVIETMQVQFATPTGVYAVSHVTPSRTLDATAATLAELRQVVGTMIEDLQNKGSFAS